MESEALCLRIPPMLPQPLKIAITHTRFSYTGGVEKYIHSLVMRLLEAGHEVHYLAARWEKHEHPRLHFHRVPMVRFPHSLRVLSFNRNCNRILDAHDFDLVHGFTKTDRQDIYTDGSGTLLEYIDATHGHRPRWWRRLYRATPHQRAILRMERGRFQRDAVYRILPMARFVRDQILTRYPVRAERVEVVYNGVELDHFHPRNRASLGEAFRHEHGIAADVPLLLFVGNDWKRKGLEVLIDALPEIVRRAPATPMVLVAGHENHPEQFRSQAQARGVQDRLLWLGPVREIRAPFAAADVFLFPSRYDVFGNVGLEALASGVPVLLSGKAGVSEVLDGSPGGALLEDPEDAGELAGKTIELLDPARLQERRRAARAIAEPYSWDRHFGRILAIYAEVLAEKRAAPAAALEIGAGRAGA